MPTDQTLTERLQLLEMAEQLEGLGHWRYDVRTGAVGWSAEMFRLHGETPSDIAPTYEALLAFYLPSDARRLDGLVQRAILNGEAYSFEGRLARRDGQVRTVRVKAHCQLDDAGACTTLFGVFQDVTDQLRSQRVTQTLLSQFPALAAYWNRDLKCVFANNRYVEWFGLTPESIVGVSMPALWGENLFEANRSYVEAALQGEVCVFERSLTKPSGEFAHMLAQYVPDKDDDGEVHGFFLLVSDITELKTSELRLAAANAELVEARNAAEAATRAKSEFLSNMSHELRTPLTSIVGFSELLVRGDTLDPKARLHLQRVREAADALLSTINDVLDFSKLEAGQIDIEGRAFDPEQLARSTLDLVQPQADAKNLTRVFEGEGLPEQVLGDETRIRQILLNLLSNALKFTTRGSVTLSAHYDKLAQTLRYEVRDTGLGIPEDRLPRLFQRFSQVDSSTTRRFGGTGLGLAICRGLAEAMDGTIGVESTPGVGSIFWFELPCFTAGADSDAQSSEDELDLLDALQGLRVLVVDDNPSNRELARIVCEGFGVSVVEAEGGGEAIVKANSYPFDVILLDIRMPEIDGPTAARIIRTTRGPNAGTPIIGFSADAASEFPEAWRTLFDARLAKPIVPAELLSSLAAFSPEFLRTSDAAA